MVPRVALPIVLGTQLLTQPMWENEVHEGRTAEKKITQAKNFLTGLVNWKTAAHQPNNTIVSRFPLFCSR